MQYIEGFRCLNLAAQRGSNRSLERLQHKHRPSISWWCLGLLGLLGLWASQVSWASMSCQDTWASWASSMLKAFKKAFNIEEAQEAHVSWKDIEAQETWEAQRPKRPKRPRHHQLMEGQTLLIFWKSFVTHLGRICQSLFLWKLGTGRLKLSSFYRIWVERMPPRVCKQSAIHISGAT